MTSLNLRKMKKAILVLLCVALMAFFAVGCNENAGSGSQSGKTENGDNSGNNNSGNSSLGNTTNEAEPTDVSANGSSEISGTFSGSCVDVTLILDKASYEEGEEVNYTIRIENKNSHSQVNSFSFSIEDVDGMKAKDDVKTFNVPIIKPNESYECKGILIPKDVTIKDAVAGAAAKFIDFIFPANVAVAQEYEVEKIRPYLDFAYAGNKKRLRAVMEIHILQQKIIIGSSEKDIAKTLCCHDPSIFKGADGKYYILGTHMGAGVSDDLRNWTQLESSFRASFTTETKNQIRAWNKDNNVGNWYDYLWAPDVVYNEKMGKYCMYLSANGDDWKSNIVLLTSDDIMGPYSYVDSIVYGGFDESNYKETDIVKVCGESLPQRYITNGVKNHKWGDEYPNCIDPCVYYDDDGNLRMVYGSWSGGIFLLELDEETGLRDYNVKYDTNAHSDAYFGKKIAGGKYVSGEGPYIQKIGDFYYLFISYGNLEANGGYNVRIFRSKKPDGDFVDMLGNTPFYDVYEFNYNQSKGVRLFGGYKWRTFSFGQVAQGHNSAFVDDDGKAYIVCHTRTTNGTEQHYVKIHQLFTNKEGWLVAAPFGTNGETLQEGNLPTEEIVGEYEVIIHDLQIDYKNLETKKPVFINFKADGTIEGDLEGEWEIVENTPYIYITLDDICYSGVLTKMKIENTNIETVVFTALGENQITIWGMMGR